MTQNNKVKAGVVLLISNFRIGQKGLNGIYGSGRDIRFFIGDIPPSHLIYNKNYEYIMEKDVLFKHGNQSLTLETIREFSYLTSGQLEFMIISESDDFEAFRIDNGKLRRLEVRSVVKGKIDDTIFLEP